MAFHACRFRDNGQTSTGGPWAGLYYRGPGSGHPRYKFRGIGTVHDCRFETDQTNDHSIWLHRLRALDLVRCNFDTGDVRLESDVYETHAERSRFANGANFIDASSGANDNFNISDVSL